MVLTGSELATAVHNHLPMVVVAISTSEDPEGAGIQLEHFAASAHVKFQRVNTGGSRALQSALAAAAAAAKSASSVVLVEWCVRDLLSPSNMGEEGRERGGVALGVCLKHAGVTTVLSSGRGAEAGGGLMRGVARGSVGVAELANEATAGMAALGAAGAGGLAAVVAEGEGALPPLLPALREAQRGGTPLLLLAINTTSASPVGAILLLVIILHRGPLSFYYGGLLFFYLLLLLFSYFIFDQFSFADGHAYFTQIYVTAEKCHLHREYTNDMHLICV
jgi:hypothetical protein